VTTPARLPRWGPRPGAALVCDGPAPLVRSILIIRSVAIRVGPKRRLAAALQGVVITIPTSFCSNGATIILAGKIELLQNCLEAWIVFDS